MSMSKKHFIALADHLRPVRDQLTPDVLHAVEGFCQSQNYNFKRDRWEGYLKGENGPDGGASKLPRNFAGVHTAV